MLETVSTKSVIRLSAYRGHLRALMEAGEQYVFSHELASRTGYTAAQIRRDLMCIETEGSAARGYDIKQLHKRLDDFIDGDAVTNVVLLGAGGLGKVLLQFFLNNRPNLKIVAAFDTDPVKTNRVIGGVHCYSTAEAPETIDNLKATVAIVAVPGRAVSDVSQLLRQTGIRGVLNFAPVSVRLPDIVTEIHVDITSMLEAVACLAGQKALI